MDRDTTMSLSYSTALTKLLCQLKCFTCHVQNWTLAAFIHFFNRLRDNKSINYLDIELPELVNSDHANVAHEACKTLYHFLQANDVVETLKLSMRSENSCKSRRVIKAIEDGFCQNRSVKTLKLSWFHAVQDVSFQQLFSAESGLEHLTMERINFRRARCWERPPPEPGSSTNNKSVLRKIEICNCFMTPEFLQEMLHHISSLCNLQELRIVLDVDDDSGVGGQFMKDQHTTILTERIAAILQKGKLISLQVLNITLDMKVIFDELRKNCTLKVFQTSRNLPAEEELLILEILENWNTSLITCQVWSDDEKHENDDFQDRVRYYTAMNRIGRAQVRSSSVASFSDYVKLLVAANNISMQDYYERPFALLYGLLRESPGIWNSLGFHSSNTHSHRKRKIEAVL
jgi:hypothetical protein